MTNYLFVDGAYLRERLEAFGKRYFNGEFEIDYRKLFGRYEKVFYFDCSPPQRTNEAPEAFNARKEKAEESFTALRRLPGCHVFIGDHYCPVKC
jgi:hypothetical protein